MKGPSGGSILECAVREDDDEINSLPRVKSRFAAGVRLVQKASFFPKDFCPKLFGPGAKRGKLKLIAGPNAGTDSEAGQPLDWAQSQLERVRPERAKLQHGPCMEEKKKGDYKTTCLLQGNANATVAIDCSCLFCSFGNRLQSVFETAAANARLHCDGELKSKERRHPDWCLRASVIMSCFPCLPGFANNIRARLDGCYGEPMLWQPTQKRDVVLQCGYRAAVH